MICPNNDTLTSGQENHVVDKISDYIAVFRLSRFFIFINR